MSDDKTSLKYCRQEIRDFAVAMEDRLRGHDEERGDGWKNESATWLLNRLHDEVKEMNEAADNWSREDAFAEAVDVANFAMMIAWRCGRDD